MARENNGEVFEKMVGVINRSLIDTPTPIQVYQRYFIENMYGIKREIDIFIKTSTGNIAIECKDWRSKSKKVKLELIDAYHGKTSLIPLVDKRIFVARGKFQKGAKKLAESLGIELYNLDEIALSTVHEWFEWNEAKQLKIDWSVTKIALKSKRVGNHILAVPNWCLLDVEGVGSNTVDEIIKAHIDDAFHNFQNICLEQYFQGRTKFLLPDVIEWDGPVVKVSLYGVDVIINQIFFSIVVEITAYGVDKVDVMSYDSVVLNKQTAVSASVSYNDKTTNILHFVKTKENNSIDAYIEEVIAGQTQITPLISHEVFLDNQ